MIARSWLGHVPRQHSDGFARHLADTALAECARIAGYAGAQVLRRTTGDTVEFHLTTYWHSWEALRRFAGNDADRAVGYPGDEAFGLVGEPRVENREVAAVVPPVAPEPAAGTVAFVGGYVVPMTAAPIPDGTVLVRDGVIAAVGPRAEVAVPDDVPVVDAAGAWVLPGFVEPHAHLGIDEEASGWAGDDLNEKTDPNGARLRALDGINPADLGFVDALAGGVTTAVVLPGSANPIGGRAVAVKCWGRTVEDMLLREPVGVKSALGENPKRVWGDRGTLPSTRLGIAAVIRDAFGRARDYRARRDVAAVAGDPFDHDPTLDLLVRVLDRELPWCQHVHRADDIATALRLADEFGYRLILNHGTEAHLLADLIAARGVPVVSGPLMMNRAKNELRHRSLRGPGILARAGVLLALTTDHSTVPAEYLVHQAILAVKEGLDRDTALRAITANPAGILGLDDRVGGLRPGLDGDVVLWSGDPLDVMSRALHVYLGGRQVYRYDFGRGTGVTASPYPVSSPAEGATRRESGIRFQPSD